MRTHSLFQNISYSFSANFISFIVSIFMVIFVPRFLSVEEFGLWQLFLFYFSYLGFLHFGWEDGIYLRYAGENFSNLDEKIFSGQFCLIFLFQIAIAALVIWGGYSFVDDVDKRIALICAVSIAPVVNFNNLCNFIMQITNRIQEYAIIIFTERILLLIGVSFLLFFGYRQYIYIYEAKIVSLLGAMAVGGYLCRKLLQLKFNSLSQILIESWENISVGIKLMFANIASMLIVGVIRYGISMGWDVATFGRISLTLGISNFLMIFINSLGVVFFPLIKRMDGDERSGVYVKIRNILAIVLFTGLLIYYPLKFTLCWWLPQYADSLIYMSVLFPVCLFESKVSLLINTYLKSMCQEFLMLKINITSVVISIVITIITVGILNDLNVTIFSIVAIYAFRCVLAEYYIEKLLNISLTKDILIDLMMALVFMISGWIFDNWLCMVVYGMGYLIFINTKCNEVKQLFFYLKAYRGDL